MKPTELKTDVYFFGKLAGATRHEASRLARGAGYRVATTLHEGVGLVVLGEGADLGQTRVALAQAFDEKSRQAFENGTLRVVSESQFLARLVQFDEPLGAAREKSQGATPAAVASLGAHIYYIISGFNHIKIMLNNYYSITIINYSL